MAKEKKTTATPEETFQEAANKYATCAIGNIREMVEAMEHAEECSGERECPACEGTGKLENQLNCDTGETPECDNCKGTGIIECIEGKDSDEPEAWHDRDRARERIEEDALSVEVRSDWHTPGDEDADATDYQILITTGGPAARIVGELDQYKQPRTAIFEYQDWFKPWTEVYTDSADTEVMLTYARCFYFGE